MSRFHLLLGAALLVGAMHPQAQQGSRDDPRIPRSRTRPNPSRWR